MELSGINGARRTPPATPAAEARTRETAAGRAMRQRSEDRIQLSRQAAAALAQVQKEQAERAEKHKQSWLDQMLESGRKQADSTVEQMKTQERCQKIAARIMRGDKVPRKDEQYLMQKDPEAYQLAILLRRQKEHPEECKSVLKDEDEQGGEAAGESAPLESGGEADATAGAPEAGGDGAAPEGGA